ncbi:MAG: amidohydrolase family protein [Coprothermobacterota bacterium]|nr:amidohydrolase family protein [Coprothermobacterota bacterium]
MKQRQLISYCSLMVVILSLGFFAACRSDSAGKVQLFANGSIYIDADRKVDNLLVRDGIVEEWNVDPAKYKDAELVDLKGAAAYPGFCDSHVHLAETGYFFHVGANLLGCNSVDDIVKVLEAMVIDLPANATVFGGGFSLRDYDKWTLEDLAKIDLITGDRPAFLADKLGHNAIINSATIKLSGMTSATKIPLGGKMGVENGRLTGMLRESAMILPWNKITDLFDEKEMKDGAMLMAQRWASIGYTAIVDLMGGPGVRYMFPDVLFELEIEGKLPLRVNYCYTIFNLNDVDDAAKYKNRSTDLVRFLGCKIFVDGAFAGGQAWTSWENQQGGHGLQEIYTDDMGGPELNLNRIVAKVEEYGMNMHYHTQGDRAIGAVLDALDKVRADKGEIKGIHTLIHLAFPTDEQIERIKSFDGHVVATVQPGFWQVEVDTAYYYGDWAEKAYPVKKLIESGISVGISTDFSVSPPQYTPVTAVIGVAATGGGIPELHSPISVKEMIRGLTVGSAQTTGSKDVGTLDIGKKADLVVFNQDLYSVAPEKFTQDYPKVLATYIGGRKVFSYDNNGAN